MIGDYLNFRDMIDGGGAGASGSEFKGGPISGLLNEIGVKPAGYRERTASMGKMPMMRPDRPAPAPARAQTAPTQYAPSGMTPANAYVPTGTNPVTPYDEALRFIASQAQPQMQYGGRGYVGMPMEPTFANDPMYSDTLAYLRSLGAVNY